MKRVVPGTPAPASSPGITCEELIRFLLDYLSGDLPPDRQREFEKHLAICPSCVAYLETYRATIQLARATLTPPEPGREELSRELVAAILAARR